MAFDASRPDLTIGIVGAGLMGRGIAQVAAEAGITVLLADARREAVAEGRAFALDRIARRAAKGQIDANRGKDAASRLVATQAGADRGYAAFAPCHLVIEAVAEHMEAKHAVLAGVEAAVGDSCIIATNTSSLSVTGFAAKARRPQRVAGFHFFNPVPLMRLVEVIGGVLTDPGVLAALTGVARRLGHHPVRATDTPGFLVNHAGRAFGTEALRIVQEGIATFADIDRVMVDAAGFRMGPFELMDLTGLDVSHAVMESIYRQYYEEARYRPVPITAQRVMAGLFGRKSGRGFYTYKDAAQPGGPAVRPPEPPAPAIAATDAPPVWISPCHAAAAQTLRAAMMAAGARLDGGQRPAAGSLAVVTPFGEDTTSAALAQDLDPERTVAVDMLIGFDRRRTLMRTPVTLPAMRDAAHALLAAGGIPVTVIGDSPGFIAQRILAAIVNVGSDIAQQRIAAPADIDRAVVLGLGYPEGPLAFGDTLRPACILSILDAMHRFYGDPRYRPSPWLKRRAALGISLAHEDM